MKRLFVFMALAAALAACGGNKVPAHTGKPKLVILGFDGMDPDLVREFMAQGQLPNMKRLMEQGGLYDLGTTVSAESPTAWASFATGVNPGKHNIYDFLIRDTSNYVLDLGMVRRIPAVSLADVRFIRSLPGSSWLDGIPVARPKVVSIRGGESFWVTAGKAGVPSSILTVPVTFPPETVPNGEMLSGLPLPDIRGTMGTFYYFATDLSRYEEGDTEFGGILKHLTFDGATAKTELQGPPNPLIKKKIDALYDKGSALSDADRTKIGELKAKENSSLPMTINWTRGSNQAVVTLAGETLTLKTGEWSKWINVRFDINFLMRVHGMVQLLVMNAGNELQLYVSPVNFRPDAPPTPMSYPEDFAGKIYKKIGPYRTLGWAEATWPLNEGRMDEKTFMDDLYKAFDDRAQVIINRLTEGNWDVLVGVIESTDRVQHMMWRYRDTTSPLYNAADAAKYGDSILRIYRRADNFIAEVLEHLEPDTEIMIVSDHGFHSWNKAVNVNTWLVQQGYMVLKGQGESRDRKLDDLFGGGTFWENVDWSKTRAYAMGLGQIYFNVRGREAEGIVSPGAEYVALADEMVKKLKSDLIDPDTKQHIVRNVYKRDDVYTGEYLGNASDLQLGFEDGYRVSWQTAQGGTPKGIVYNNTQKWSGDHGGFDYETTAGVLITNRPISTTTPNIIDIAPTVLQHFGVPIPKSIDGKPLRKQ
ncbi:MAG: hypothetical protein EPO35_08365 [Acidobacteria bacterium]|nr:MAG: hypothetical protein EPO35_08365 [Acidobacteriota bacterium]